MQKNAANKERVAAAAADVQKQREHASGESRERVKAMLIELAQSAKSAKSRASECSTENKLAAPQQRNDEKMAEQSYKRSALSLRV